MKIFLYVLIFLFSCNQNKETIIKTIHTTDTVVIARNVEAARQPTKQNKQSKNQVIIKVSGNARIGIIDTNESSTFNIKQDF